MNRLSAHNLLKLSSITAYNRIYKYDFICISETYLDSSAQSADRDISINGCKLIRADHPSNSKRGGVCIFYRESFAVQLIKINYLNECLFCEVSFNNKKSYIAVLYWSPSQNSLEFDNFILSFEKLLCEINSFKPDFSIILGNFNARSNSWWIGDIEASEGSRINALTTSYGFQQLISEPTHILNNSSSCIDLIFTDEPNLVINSGTHLSLHLNCHHKITHFKIYLKITYPPPHKRLVWDFKRANIPSIRKAIKMVDWRFMFLNKSVHDQVSIFSNTLINIFSNYIPHRYVTVDDRDPPWMTEIIKNKIKLKSSLYKSNKFISLYKSNKFIDLQNLSKEISTMILERKEKYYNHLFMKLNNPNTSAKTYWSTLKSFYNDCKVPLIPPLLVNDKIVSDFTKKARIFNDFFTFQCTPLNNSSVLPAKVTFKTQSRLNCICFEEDDILKIIRNLNIDKAHCHDNISIRMLKICHSVVVEPLSLIFKNCIDSGIFPNLWKKSHIIPTHKKNDKRCINNYRPVSLLPIYGKIFERIIYNPVYLYLENKDLLNPHQSGFRPNNSCI